MLVFIKPALLYGIKVLENYKFQKNGDFSEYTLLSFDPIDILPNQTINSSKY